MYWFALESKFNFNLNQVICITFANRMKTVKR